MKKNFVFLTLMCLFVGLVFTSCKQDYPGYKKTADGLYYRFINRNENGKQPQMTDFLKVKMACYLNDSLYYGWKESNGEVHVQLSDPHFPGDLQSAYAMMREGDSASFYIKADSIAVKYYNQSPEAVGLMPTDRFRYEVKVLEIKTKDEFQAEIEKMKEEMANKSREEFAAYVKEKGITVSPEPSGIYIIPLEKGTGRCPVKGEKVELDFVANLLNGVSLGSTYEEGEKLSFVLGKGTTIQGWEEIVPKMHLGERVRAIIPFDMAYGDRAVGSIPPYSNLVYDIKLLKITTAEEVRLEEKKEMEALKAESGRAFQDYLIANNITDHTASGLYYKKNVVTDGKSPVAGSTARIKFVASYLDGTPLGDSDKLGGHYDVVYGSGSVLKGLDEGIGLMKTGESARFVLPYTLAYGARPYGNIPAYSNLVFDVDLLEVLSAEEANASK